MTNKSMVEVIDSPEAEVRVALVGCGAVTTKSHVPALLRLGQMRVSAFVDSNLRLAEQLCEEVGTGIAAVSLDSLQDEFDLAVIATPSSTHANLVEQSLHMDKHVLVEKPLAATYQDAVSLIELARNKNRLLAVSLVRRYSPQFSTLSALLKSGMLGRIKSFSIEEGGVFAWPVQSPSFFDPKVSGGGVLMDHGAHLLDACTWWFGDFESVVYSDDSMGGVEADCELRLRMKNGAEGLVRMSRLRNLSNTVQVNAENANLVMNLATGLMTINPRVDACVGLQAHSDTLDGESGVDVIDLFETQYRYLAAAVAGHDQQKLVTADDCIDSIRMIDACYQQQGQHDYVIWK